MNKEQIKEEFKFFMEKCSKSPGSYRNYLSGFSTVEKYIKVIEPDFTTLLENVNPDYLFSIYERLMRYDEFVNYNSSKQAKSMYSNAFLSYVNFLFARKFFNSVKSDINIRPVGEIVSIYRTYITAIKSKPFLLLAGISGTGKSRIVRELARACWEKGSEEYKAQKPKNFEMIQVKPNWHDSSELIGYVSRVSGEPVYVSGDFLKFIAKAWENLDVPHFLCLDEMNLAPVEQYFAEYLSVIESRKNINGEIVTDAIIEKNSEKWYLNLVASLTENANIQEQFKTEGITIPKNLIVVGTVNMDETTFSFSRKVRKKQK